MPIRTVSWGLLVVVLTAPGLTGCGNRGGRPAASGPHEEGKPEADTFVSLAPQPLGGERLIDLALFDAKDVAHRVRGLFSSGLSGRFEVPWTKKNPGGAMSAYWVAPPGTQFTLDLGRACYVSYIIVQPFTKHYGVGAVRVQILSEKNEELTTEPPAVVSLPPGDPAQEDAPAEALVAGFSPRFTQRLKFTITRGALSPTDNAYISRIRVLGRPARLETIAKQPAPLPPALRETLAANAANLAEFDRQFVEEHVIVSDDQYPNGRYDQPFLRESASQPSGEPISPYWCALQPAWVEVDLGKLCAVNAVRVTPYSGLYGVTAFYAKVLDAEGNELDTDPPVDVQQTPPAPDDGPPLEPLPLESRFEPVLTQKLKFYFVRGGALTNRVYVGKIEVLGVPAPKK